MRNIEQVNRHPVVIQQSQPATRWGMRWWVICGACVLYLGAFIALVMVYMLASLSEWVSLLLGLLIVLLFFGMIIALGVATHAP
jgi:hypothetical protein